MNYTLLVFRGKPGTGKSTLAKFLHSKLGWPLIIRDDIKEDLVKKGVDELQLGAKSYSLMWQQVKSFLELGKSCICDTNLFQPVTVADLEKFSGKAKILIIECFVGDKKIHKQRLGSRKNQGLTGFWIDNWEKYQDYLRSSKNSGAIDVKIPYPLLRVDTGKQIDIDNILAWINQ